MRSWFLLLFRFCLAAWVGIACFFLATVLGLRNPELFTADVMRNHPKVLFPLFYSFEFGLLAAALVCGLLAAGHPNARTATSRWALVLAGVALAVAVADWVWVYRPLAEMLDMQTLPANFAAYHHASRWINTGQLLLCAAAAGLAIWPGERGVLTP